jgi:tRNA pseudouridine13 synthase
MRTVLAEEGLTPADMQIKGIRELFFSKGERAAVCVPTGLTAATAADDLHPGREMLTLAFELPRGGYATLVVKAAVGPRHDVPFS